MMEIVRKDYLISLVILHYNEIEATINLIEDIKSLKWDEIKYKIIVVDNCSPDNSGDILLERYFNDEKVDILRAKKNCGFARGNNIGIVHAQKEYNADFIIVSNNDIRINDKFLPQKIVSAYFKYNFAVLAPNIYCPRKNEYQNPFKEDLISKQELKYKIFRDSITLFWVSALTKMRLYDFLKSKRGIGANNCITLSEIRENIVPHGSFFVLSRNYLEIYPDGLFGQTFLYMEEYILAYRCNIKNLKIIFNPDINIIHLDGASSLSLNRSYGKKRVNELRNTIKSCKSFLSYMKSTEIANRK